MFSVCVCEFFCVGVPCEELITRPRSPTDCPRSRKLKRNGEFYGNRPRPKIGAVAPKKKNVCIYNMHKGSVSPGSVQQIMSYD
jgi:hypothetical protein